MQEPSIFTRILHGDIFQEMIYEDDLCFVILTHEPITPGHCLVIPKQETAHLWDLPDDIYQHVLAISKEIANRINAAYTYPRVGMIVEGFGVPTHAHIHVLGYLEGLEPTIIKYAASKSISSPEELKVEADKLRA